MYAVKKRKVLLKALSCLIVVFFYLLLPLLSLFQLMMMFLTRIISLCNIRAPLLLWKNEVLSGFQNADVVHRIGTKFHQWHFKLLHPNLSMAF